jgi:hypothetical protein
MIGRATRIRSLLFLASVSLVCVPLKASDLVPFDQRDYPDSANGCAPATALNLLRFGGNTYAPVLNGLIGSTDGVKMRFLVDRYFRLRPSTLDPSQMRWGVHGIDCRDLVTGLNELLADHALVPLAGAYLDREPEEKERDHLARIFDLIRRSLAEETPPMLNLRTFLVKSREENGGEPEWETGVSHYVLVTGIHGEPSDTGGELEVIDPWQGRRTVIYLHREPNGRDFRALKGSETSGEWLAGRPFLQVLAPGVPTMRPANLDWHERYLVIANHLIGRF